MTPTINNPIRPRPPGWIRINKNPIKTSALFTLREVLLKEKYEECAEVIAIAYEFGANEMEVQNILEDPRRLPAH